MSSILIISSSTKSQEWAAALMEAGFAVARADSADVLETIARTKPDLMLFDTSGDAELGLAVVGAIRSDARLARLPIILISRCADEERRTLGLDAGADDYLNMATSSRELVWRISAVLRRSRNA